MQLPQEITQMNRGQMLVVIIGLLAAAWLLIQRFVITDPCINKMCPANDWSWAWKVGLLFAATALAYWLLKSPTKK
jgi:LPS O-antigen subunit length determinant protein (WzzB/FepE family)